MDTPIQRLVEICDAAIAQIGDQSRSEAIVRIKQRLNEPIILAIAGREKAGKSTLVNALLGRRVAPTSAGPCTKLVTTYRFSPRERVEIMSSGSCSRTLPVTGANVADGLNRSDLAGADAIDVYISNRRLRSLTIVDTPGLESADTESSDRTKQFLSFDGASTSAVVGADAMVYVFQHLRGDDRIRLSDFASAFPGAHVSALNTIGVLGRVDTLGGDMQDPWRDAHAIALRYRDHFSTLMLDIIPVIGLISESVTTGGFREADAAALRALAALDGNARMRLTLTADRFLSLEVKGVSADARARLLDLIGMHGIIRALALIDSGTSGGAKLAAGLEAMSNVEAVRSIVANVVADHGDVIKCSHAITQLETLTYQSEGLERIRERLSSVRLDPQLHQLTEIDALRSISSGAASPSTGQRIEITNLFVGGSLPEKLSLPATSSIRDLATQAAQRAGYWQGIENDECASAADRALARVVKTSYVLLYTSAKDQWAAEAAAI